MKNKIVYMFISKVRLRIIGKNINRFIMRIHKNNIDILKCDYINDDEVSIVVYNKDYESILKIKTIYNIEVLDTFGLIKIKKNLRINRYLIISLIFGIFLFKFLSSIIFEVEVVHNDVKTREFLKRELALYNIKEKKFKKSYSQIEGIKEEILNKYKDKIEWLEIEEKGTKYIVRVELRKILEEKVGDGKQNVIAGKDAVIKEIKATSGQIVKSINNYVKKGDVVISGNIYANEEVKDTVPAQGTVYGEVWYEINVTYPFAYSETRELDRKRDVLVLKFLNRSIEFSRKHFKNKKVDEQVLLKSGVLPISLVRQRQTEVSVIDQILTVDEAAILAKEKAVSKISENLDDDEYIMNYKVLSTNVKESELELSVFFSVYENITEYEVIVDDMNIE